MAFHALNNATIAVVCGPVTVADPGAQPEAKGATHVKTFGHYSKVCRSSSKAVHAVVLNTSSESDE